MSRRNRPFPEIVRALSRAALLVAALLAPLAAMQAVEASTQTVIGHERAMPSGAGLVLLFGLQRA